MLLMSYKGGVRTQADSPGRTGKDFFISQPCQVKLQITVFGLTENIRQVLFLCYNSFLFL
ncbi:MAG: hypothetical protein H6Q94_654 [Nitrospirae bacterium]|nr:hypothetical protein [Nitrospirota bacterium]